MLRPSFLRVVIALLLGGTTSLGAQQPTPDDRIRISHHCTPDGQCPTLSGRFVSWQGTTLTLSDEMGEVHPIDLSPQARVSVFRGTRRYPGHGLLIGALFGFVTFRAQNGRCDGRAYCELNEGAYTVGGGLFGLLLGALTRTDRWEGVVQPTIAIGSVPGSLSLGARLRF